MTIKKSVVQKSNAKRARVIPKAKAFSSVYWRVNSRLLPVFAVNPAQPGDAVRRDARELRAAFERLREAPLAPYYAAIGAEFFGWLDAVAR